MFGTFGTEKNPNKLVYKTFPAVLLKRNRAILTKL